MKTFNQHIKSGNAISMDDIIFEGRNQEYGAFALRKNSNQRVIYSFLITFLFIAPIFIIGYLNKGKITKPDDEIIIPISITKVDKSTYTPPPPPVLPKELNDMLKRNSVSSGIEVVDTVHQFKNNVPFLIEQIPIDPGSNIKVEYIDTGTGIKDPDIPNFTKPFIRVEEEATFKGGTINDFVVWATKHLNYPEKAIEMELQGKVTVQFVVNAEGKTEDIKILRGTNELLDNEAIRVIGSSPKWNPARQQGYVVKQQFVIPINFKLER